MRTKSRLGFFALAGCFLTLVSSVIAADLTAFQLVKEGDHFVSDEAKDKVVEIRSEKSVASVVPNIWYVVYYDPDATFKATQVKFGAGKKMEVKRPTRMLEYVNDDSKPFDSKRLNIDSDKAYALASKDPLFAGLTLSSSQFWLQHIDTGPVWKIRFWCLKVHNPNDDADIGDIYVSADDGKIIKRDLHTDHAN